MVGAEESGKAIRGVARGLIEWVFGVWLGQRTGGIRVNPPASRRRPQARKGAQSTRRVGAETLNDVVGSSGLVTDEVRYSLPSFGWRNCHASYSEEHITLAKRG
jgi:hypothetical protein